MSNRLDYKDAVLAIGVVAALIGLGLWSVPLMLVAFGLFMIGGAILADIRGAKR